MSYIFLLYLADIVEQTSSMFTLFGVTGVITCVLLFIIMSCCIDTTSDEDQIIAYKKYRHLAVTKLYIPVLLVIFATFLPSKTFIYTAVALKAGVEITAEIKENPIVSKGLMVIERYLDDTLNPVTDSAGRKALRKE